jgi:hypothetical protein
MSVPRSLCVIGGGLLALGCAGKSLLVAEERASTEPAAADSGPDAGAASNQPGVALTQDCPPSPGERRGLLGCWPTQHLGRFRGRFIGAPRYPTLDGKGDDFPAGELVLELAIDGTGELSFGAVGAPGEGDPCADVESARCASLGRLLPGFGYRLDDILLYDPKDEPPRVEGEPPRQLAESMSFAIRLGQPWEARCAEQAPANVDCPSGECAAAPTGQRRGPAGAAGAGLVTCLCSQTGCLPSAPSLAFTLRMSADHQALRGLYSSTDPSVDDARLDFERER